MACCGQGETGKGKRLPFPLALLAVVVLSGLSALLLAIVALVTPFSREARTQFAPLARGCRDFLAGSYGRSLDQPFLVDGTVRCRLSGRLYPASGVLAGWLYRYFNFVVLGLVTGMVAGLALVAQAVGG